MTSLRFVISLIAQIHLVFGNDVLIEVEQGVLLGNQLDLVTGDGTYYNFRGIPYAQPPIGSLRFKAPQPPLSWNGIRNATEHGSVCPQIQYESNTFIGTEDCLYLNVYSPNITADPLLSVMIYIHGGIFAFGSGDVSNYGPDFLVRKGVVLVTINYRLGALGFLSLNTKDVPGNAGLRDQVAAMKWVKKNIHKFGGDPDKVTLFGDSAGGASVAYHAISPVSKGLFHRAMAMSGSPWNDWAIPYESERRAFILGLSLGCDTNNKTELLNFLEHVSYEKFVLANPTVLALHEIIDGVCPLYLFAPVYEDDWGQEIFLTQNLVYNLEEVNEIDFMFGYTSHETMYGINKLENYILNLYDRFREMFAPCKILVTSEPHTILEISDRLRKYYFGNQSINIATIKEMIDYTSNAVFLYDIIRFYKALPNPGNKSRYFYKFSCYSERNVYGVAGTKYGIYGASHVDDTFYLFDPKAYNMTLEKNSTTYDMVDLVTNLVTNFAKYGNPTPDSTLGVIWPQFNAETLAYMDINRTLTVSYAPNKADVQFWDKIYESAEIQPVART